jgi:nucleotide-binding universal stress UspA family protein
VARAFGAKTTLLHVQEQDHSLEETQAIDPLDWHLRRAEGEAYLDGVVHRLQELGIEVERKCVEGQPAERVIEFAHRNGVNLIALSSHGQSGLSGWNVSSVVQKVISRAHTSTLLVRAYQPVRGELKALRYRRLVVTLDCSQRAECVLPVATTLARTHGAQLMLMNVVRRPEMPRRTPLADEDVELADKVVERNQQEAVRYFDQLRSRMPSDIEDIQHHILVDECAASALHDLVERENAELVIMSAHGHSGGNKWPYGSVTVSFIAYGNTPLLIVQDLSLGELKRSLAEIAATEYKGH